MFVKASRQLTEDVKIGHMKNIFLRHQVATTK